MSREELPPECRHTLDYASTIETLKLLENEEVSLLITTAGDSGKSSRIQAAGALKHYSYDWAEGIAIGDGARVVIWAPDFVSAELTTFDGNDFFRIAVTLRGLDFVIGDVSMQTDEFDLFP